jgi:hypothetical protein
MVSEFDFDLDITKYLNKVAIESEMSTYDMSTCRDVLSSKRLSDVLQSQHVVTVRSSASVDQTLRVGYIDRFCAYALVFISSVGCRRESMRVERASIRCCSLHVVVL